MKKQILSMLLVCGMSAFLFACGNESTQPTEQTETVESTEQQATEEIPTTDIADSTEAEPAEEPTTEQETVESTETEAPTAEQETAESTEPTEEATVQYTYTDLSATMYAQQTVNVRNQPSTDGEKVGSLSTNQEVSVSGQCNETSWYRIEYNGATAYVSNSYLGNSMVEVVQSNDNSADLSTNTENPYPLFQVIDEGGDKVYFYYTWDGVTTQKSTEFWSTWNECIGILAERHGWEYYYDGAAHLGGNVYDFGPSDKTGYYVDGNYVMRARPQCCPNTTVPAQATEIAGWQ